MNNKYINKEVDCFYDKVKCQWFNIASSGKAHSQGKAFLIALMIVKHMLSEVKHVMHFEPRFRD